MNVLVACEFSGIVREAFNAYHGVNAYSCDLLPPEDGRVDYHFQMDILELLKHIHNWDLMIAFPPCTFLANSGVRWLHEKPGRWDKMWRAVGFFNELLNANIPFIAVENPVPHKYARNKMTKTYDQIIQPYQFGHGEIKKTCLWLQNLPKLIPTNIVDGRTPRVHYESPSPTRWMERSRTLTGIAQAMAEQWIPYVLENQRISVL